MKFESALPKQISRSNRKTDNNSSGDTEVNIMISLIDLEKSCPHSIEDCIQAGSYKLSLWLRRILIENLDHANANDAKCRFQASKLVESQCIKLWFFKFKLNNSTPKQVGSKQVADCKFPSQLEMKIGSHHENSSLISSTLCTTFLPVVHHNIIQK